MQKVLWQRLPTELAVTSACALATYPKAFPVRRVYCVGQNYAKHAAEMGSARADPFFFSKPTDTVLTGPIDATTATATIVVPFPPETKDWQHEVELVVGIGHPLLAADAPAEYRNLTPTAAATAVFGVAVGLDMTRRDLQKKAKETGRPWDLAKGSDASAPCGPLTPLVDLVARRRGISREAAEALVASAPTDAIAELHKGSIQLLKDGAAVQTGDLSEMVWTVPEIVAHLSRFVALRPGDLIFTGTPEGVKGVRPGNVLTATIDGVPPLKATISPCSHL